MISRVRFDWLIVFCCVTVLLVPAEAFGTGFGGRSFGARPFGGRPASSAASFHRPVELPLAPVHSTQVRSGVILRRHFGSRFWPWAGYGYYGGGFGVPDYVGSSYQPALAEPEITGAVPSADFFPGAFPPVILYHRGCQTETTSVPLANGDAHAINIVRCYP